MEFSHLYFWHQPLSSLTFFALIMSIISLWIRKTPWLWGTFFAISYLLAFQAHIATPLTLIPVIFLLVGHWTLTRHLPKTTRMILVTLLTILSLALWMHVVPGFHNWELVHRSLISPDALPYSLWLNFDKPLTALFPLALTIPLITTRDQLKQAAKKTIPLSLLGIAIMLILSLYTGIVRWDPKLPTFVFVWIIENLILVSIVEEALLRGFLQKELFSAFGGQGLKANVGAVVATSFIFALIHIPFVASIPFLLLSFVAGLIYGGIYQYTKAIESSIFCHFLLNLTHLLFFTYPALAK